MEPSESAPCNYWWSVILATLEARANDEVEPEDDDVERAAISIVAATMLGIGFEPDEVMESLAESELEIYLSFDPETSHVSVNVDWGDGNCEAKADVQGLI